MIQLENRWIFLLQAVQPSLHLPQETLKSRSDQSNPVNFILGGKLLLEA